MRSIYTLALGLALLLALAAVPPALAQDQKLLASDGQAGDFFGQSIAISGNLAVIGAVADDDNGSNAGSAYVFERIGGVWVEQQKLLASDGDVQDAFGRAVGLSGNWIIVGASWDDDKGDNAGAAYVFERVGGTWVEQQKLTASDGQGDERFGHALATSGDRAIIGAFSDDDNGARSGSAYIFERIGDTWVEQQKLTASDGETLDDFGEFVGISGDLAIIGADGDDDQGDLSGAAYIFEHVGGTWVEQQKLLASDGEALEIFGAAVDISGNFAIVGSRWDDDNGDDAGAAYIFERVGGIWVEQQKLLATDGEDDEEFGGAVAISGTLAIVGAPHDDDRGENSGSAYIYERVGGTWVEQQKLLATDEQAGDLVGFPVAISDGTALVVAFSDDENANNAGAAYVFRVPALTLSLKKLIRTASGTKKVKLKWDAADVEKGKLDFYVDETPDGSFFKRTANDGKMKLKLPTSQFPGDGPFAIHACAKNATTVCSNVIIADFTGVPIDLTEPETDEEDSYASKASVEVPEELTLDGSYPNPFNPVATIRYALPEAVHVTLRVYDVLGREVETLVNAQQEAGRHEATFEASHLPSGVYVYRLEAQGQVKTGRMLLLK